MPARFPIRCTRALAAAIAAGACLSAHAAPATRAGATPPAEPFELRGWQLRTPASQACRGGEVWDEDQKRAERGASTARMGITRCFTVNPERLGPLETYRPIEMEFVDDKLATLLFKLAPSDRAGLDALLSDLRAVYGAPRLVRLRDGQSHFAWQRGADMLTLRAVPAADGFSGHLMLSDTSLVELGKQRVAAAMRQDERVSTERRRTELRRGDVDAAATPDSTRR